MHSHNRLRSKGLDEKLKRLGSLGDWLMDEGGAGLANNMAFSNPCKRGPGGTLIVPPKGPKKNYLDAMAKITQIIYQIAISVGVAVTVF